MKEIKLTQGQVALVDDEDYSKLSQFKWYAAYAKNSHSYYAVAQIKINGKYRMFRMHRMILDIADRKIHCDHINHNTLDNTKANLRVADIQQNCFNTRSRLNSTSKYKGVSWYKRRNKWVAHITKDYKIIHLGYFNNEADAARAYNDAAVKLYGEFAYLNELAA